VARDEYLKYLFSYIHLNPIKIIDPEWKENGLSKLSESKKFNDLTVDRELKMVDLKNRIKELESKLL
jgi:hypothetical protein